LYPGTEVTTRECFTAVQLKSQIGALFLVTGSS